LAFDSLLIVDLRLTVQAGAGTIDPDERLNHKSRIINHQQFNNQNSFSQQLIPCTAKTA
jgi:hypothetical protein